MANGTVSTTLSINRTYKSTVFIMLFEDRENLSLQEIPITKGYKWLGHSLRQIPTHPNTLVIMIKRGNRTIIPSGGTVLQVGDTLVLAHSNSVPSS